MLSFKSCEGQFRTKFSEPQVDRMAVLPELVNALRSFSSLASRSVHSRSAARRYGKPVTALAGQVASFPERATLTIRVLKSGQLSRESYPNKQDYPRLFCRRVAECVAAAAKTRGIELFPVIKASDKSVLPKKRSLSHQVGAQRQPRGRRLPAPIPEFKRIVSVRVPEGPLQTSLTVSTKLAADLCTDGMVIPAGSKFLGWHWVMGEGGAVGPVPGKLPDTPPGKLPGKSPNSLRSSQPLPTPSGGIKHGKFGLFLTELEFVAALLKVEHPALCNASVETDVAVA